MRSLLIVSDYKTENGGINSGRLKMYSKKEGIDANIIDYDMLMSGKIPGMKNEGIDVMYFFPFNFWNANCETPGDTGIYGTSDKAYLKFKDFFEGVSGKVEEFGKDKDVRNIINPNVAYLDRDKIKINDLLTSYGIPASEQIPKSLDSIFSALESSNLFMKSRYGAEGKGITYLSQGEWKTNCSIDGGKIGNHADSNWHFADFTGDMDILKSLVDLEMIVEKEIVTPSLGDSDVKFDVRAYSVFDSVPHMFIKRNPKEKIITNFSQGGVVDHDFRDTFSEETVKLIQKVTSESADALNANFLGVDVMFDKDMNSPKIIEVQNFPGYPKIEKFNLPRYLARRLKGDYDEKENFDNR